MHASILPHDKDHKGGIILQIPSTSLFRLDLPSSIMFALCQPSHNKRVSYVSQVLRGALQDQPCSLCHTFQSRRGSDFVPEHGNTVHYEMRREKKGEKRIERKEARTPESERVPARKQHLNQGEIRAKRKKARERIIDVCASFFVLF